MKPSRQRNTARATVRWAPGVLALVLGVVVASALAQESADEKKDGERGGKAPAGPPPSPVRVGMVEAKKLVDRRLVTGELRAARRAQVAGREPGLVLEAPVREGQVVRKGALLARIDDRQLELEKARLAADRLVAKATLKERKADLALREWQHEAFKKLAERGSSHEQEMREAASAIAVATARELQARQNLAVLDARESQLDQRIADMRITAPFDAVVIRRNVDRGEWLAAGASVAEVISTGALEAWFRMPERLTSAVRKPATHIEVHVEAAAKTTDATTFRIVPMIDPTTRTFTVIVPLPNDETALAAGMSATAWVPTDVEREYLTVPVDALLRNDVGPYVYAAVGPPDALRAVAVPVTRLFSDGGRVALRAPGLEDGDRVVVEGNERLFPSAPLSIIEVEKEGGEGPVSPTSNAGERKRP